MNQLTVSLWGDEAFTAVAVQENLLRMLNIVMKDTAPPLYYLLLFGWTRIFGHSEISIRSLSILLYLGTISLVFLIAKKIWNAKSGLIAGLLVLANPFLFPFAFEGRMYSLLVFTVTLSYYFLLINNFWGYVISTVLALYSHHYAVLAIFFQFIWQFVKFIKQKRPGLSARPGLYMGFLKPYLLIGLFYLPWLYPLSKQLSLVATGFWLGKPKLIDLPLLLAKYLIGASLIYPWQKFLLLIALIILIIKKWQDQLKQNFFLLGWIFMPIVLAFIISQIKTSVFYDRYLIFTIPALALLLAGGLRKTSYLFVLLFTLPLLIINYQYFTHPTKRPFRELAKYVKKESTMNDYLINYNGQAHHLWEAKYYGLKAPLYANKANLPYYVGTAQMTDADFVPILPDVPRVGVISSEEPKTMILPGFKLDYYQRFDSLYFSWFTKL